MYTLSSQPIIFIEPTEERELILAAQQGNINSRNKLLVSLLPMIVRLTEQMIGAGHPQFEDYVQEGVLGNIIGLQKFDLNKYKNRYYSYGYWWIRYYINNERERDQLWSSSIADITDDCFTAEEAINLTNPDNFPENSFDFLDFNSYISSIHSVILSKADILDQFREGGLSCDYDLVNEMLNLLNGDLTPKQRKIFHLYYHRNLTFREVSNKTSYSQRWVIELRNKLLAKLKKQVDILSG